MKSDYDEYRTWQSAQMLNEVVENLHARGFSAASFPSIASVHDELLRTIPESASVGIGGSVTIRELGIIEELERRGNNVTHHWGKSAAPDRETRLKEGRADYYLTSANAITMHGDIINIDGIGNRVAHMIYGPENVIIIAGCNKIVSNIDDGIRRSKQIAAVINAKRVGAKTPCATTGKCIDCDAPARICRVTTIIQYRPWQTNISVFLVNEDLGY